MERYGYVYSSHQASIISVTLLCVKDAIVIVSVLYVNALVISPSPPQIT